MNEPVQQVMPMIEPLHSGDPLRESYVKQLVHGINTANEARPLGGAPIKWAKTHAHAVDGYPDATDNPIAYPFRWVTLNIKPSAASGTTKPPRAETAIQNWEFVDGQADADVEINGYAVNMNELEFDGSTKPIDYVREGSIILVASGSVGCYWMLRERPSLFLFTTTEDIPALAGGVYSSGLCTMKAVDDTDTEGEHEVREIERIVDEVNESVEYRVINPSPSETIGSGEDVWAMSYGGGGHFVAVIWPC